MTLERALLVALLILAVGAFVFTRPAAPDPQAEHRQKLRAELQARYLASAQEAAIVEKRYEEERAQETAARRKPLRDAIAALKQLGLCTQLDETSDATFYSLGHLDASSSRFYADLLPYDKSRILVYDWKKYRYSYGGDATPYAEFIRQLSQISRGKFKAENIGEKWSLKEHMPGCVPEYEGNVVVSYRCQEKDCSFTSTNVYSATISLDVLKSINAELPDGPRFAAYLPTENYATRMIAFLTAEECKKLNELTGLAFEIQSK